MKSLTISGPTRLALVAAFLIALIFIFDLLPIPDKFRDKDMVFTLLTFISTFLIVRGVYWVVDGFIEHDGHSPLSENKEKLIMISLKVIGIGLIWAGACILVVEILDRKWTGPVAIVFMSAIILSIFLAGSICSFIITRASKNVFVSDNRSVKATVVFIKIIGIVAIWAGACILVTNIINRQWSGEVSIVFMSIVIFGIFLAVTICSWIITRTSKHLGAPADTASERTV